MSRLVVDASLALSWLLPDEASASTLGARDDLVAVESVWAPAHWRLEVCNALWMAERRKRLDATGVAQMVKALAVHDREDPLWLMAAEMSAKKAYAQAGVGPSDINLFELHDAFSIMAALSLDSHRHLRWVEGPRASGRRDRRLSDCRSGPTVARRGRRLPGAGRQDRHGAKHRGQWGEYYYPYPAG